MNTLKFKISRESVIIALISILISVCLTFEFIQYSIVTLEFGYIYIVKLHITVKTLQKANAQCGSVNKETNRI